MSRVESYMLMCALAVNTIALGASIEVADQRMTPCGPEQAAWSGGEQHGGQAWFPGFWLDDVDDDVRAFALFDDGMGPALFVGGSFSHASGVEVNGIARWNGNSWSPLHGSAGTGVDGSVNALVVFDDGSGPALFAGGSFDHAGGLEVNGVARWDGNAWTALTGFAGAGVDGYVQALTVFDDGSGSALYAAGAFATAGGVTVNHVAKWNGNDWAPLAGPAGAGMSDPYSSIVRALTVFDDGSGPALYAAGSFSNAGGVQVGNIAKWDGSAWSALTGPGGTGVNGPAYALTTFNDGSAPGLHVGGSFSTAGGVTVNRIARWSGSAWAALDGPAGAGVGGASSPMVRALTVFDDGTGPELFAGGYFDTAGGVTVNNIAKWDGSVWTPVAGPSGTGIGTPGSWGVEALTVFDPGFGSVLVAGGTFTAAGGVAVNFVASWTGTAWAPLSGAGGAGVNASVAALVVADDVSGPALFAGGYFTGAGGALVNGVASWDGSAWSALAGPGGTGVVGYVRALAVFDDGSGPALYAGGSFATAGGVAVNNIARWDGSAWAPLAGPSAVGTDSSVTALCVFDDGSGPALYAGGFFLTAGGVTANNIARWDGSTWTPLAGPTGTGMGGPGSLIVSALAVFSDGSGPALYAGGFFLTAGGVTVNNIARWDGSTWTPLTGPSAVGTDSSVDALSVFDDGSGPALYAGGWFLTAGGVAVTRIARWDGSAWAPLAGPSGVGTDSEVNALAVFDDGSGSELYAGGRFTRAGGVTVNRVARWNGTAWAPLSGPAGVGVGGGVNTWVNALAPFDDGEELLLFVGGEFTTAGEVASSKIAAWRLEPTIFADDFELGNTAAWSVSMP